MSKSVADIEGPWKDPNFDSGLIERCRKFWKVPVSELPDEMIATFLEQRFAVQLVAQEGLRRLAIGQSDDSEIIEGQLREALGTALVYAEIPWSFDQPKNCAVVTTRQVMAGEEPILLVSHDEEDHGWQFIGKAWAMADARLVGLGEIVKRDPTVFALADLPPGWEAIREGEGRPWVRRAAMEP